MRSISTAFEARGAYLWVYDYALWQPLKYCNAVAVCAFDEPKQIHCHTSEELLSFITPPHPLRTPSTWPSGKSTATTSSLFNTSGHAASSMERSCGRSAGRAGRQPTTPTSRWRTCAGGGCCSARWPSCSRPSSAASRAAAQSARSTAVSFMMGAVRSRTSWEILWSLGRRADFWSVNYTHTP